MAEAAAPEKPHTRALASAILTGLICIQQLDWLVGVAYPVPEKWEERDFAEALVYQRREEVALLDFLNGSAEAEAEAWARLQKLSLTSPWAGERSLEDIENTWLKWESKDKQVSKILGAAYKPRERVRSPGLLSINVQFDLMKHKISPLIYQNLHFNELAPTHQPDFMIHKTIDQHGRLIRMVTHNVSKDLHPSKEMANIHANASPPSSMLSSASGSGLLAGRFTSPGLQPSPALQRP